MNKTLTSLFAVCILLTSCGRTEPPLISDTPEQEEVQWALSPMVFVNDVMYQSYDFGSHLAQKLDDSWTHVGEIESSVSSGQPTVNFQTNFEYVGAEVYHSSNGSITVNPYGNDFIANGKEFFGDSIILIFENEYSQYIAIEERDRVEELQNSMNDYGQLLQVDGVIYRLRSKASGGDFKLDDTYVYLGAVMSAVPENDRPTEDFQVNSLIVEIGSEIYKLPADYVNDCDLIVICGSYRYEYKNFS